MNIPAEIYCQIFQNLPKCTVKECLTVSKVWNAAAMRIYFQDVIITDYNIITLKSNLDDKQCFRYCSWVQTLKLSITGTNCYREIKGNLQKDFTQEQFLKLTTYFPNLKKIEISNYVVNKAKYINYLVEVDSSKYLTRIEKISFGNNRLWDICDICCDLYFNYRASLKHASIYHKPESFIDCKYDGIINYLQQFRSLTHLKYCNNTDEDISLYQLHVTCPQLTKLHIYIEENVPEHEVGTIGFHNPNNLMKLILSFPFISASYIDFIVEQLPTTVEFFSIIIHEIDIYDWMDTVGIDNVMKLINRMSKVKNAYLKCVPEKYYEVAHDASEESYMTTFFRCLHAFKGDRKMICSGNFSDYCSVHHDISLENGKLNFTYGLKYEEFYGNDESETPIFAFAIPDKSVSIVGLDIMNVLEFHICEAYEGSEYQFLNYSLTNCPYLQSVEYKSMCDPRHDFILCAKLDYGLYGYEAKQDPSTTSQANLKILKVKNFIPTSDFLNLLSSNLPNINYISLGCSRYTYLSENKETTENLIVDLSNFKCLESFYFNLQFLGPEEENLARFIKFHYTDGDESYYQYINNEKAFELRSVSLNFIQTYQSSSGCIIVTFKCEKIKKFVMYPYRRLSRDFAEINYGGTPNISPLDYQTKDNWYLDIDYW